MKKILAVLAAGTILASGFSLPSFAEARYGSKPLIQTHSNGKSVWVKQLKRNSIARQGFSPKRRVQKRRTARRATRQLNRQVRRTQRQQPQKRVQKRTGIFALFNNAGTNGQVRNQKQFNQRNLRRAARPANNSYAAKRSHTKTRSGVVDLSGPMTPQRVNRMVASQKRDAAKQKPIDPRWLPQTVNYETSQKKGTIVISTSQRHLYLVLGNGKARRYGVGVGKSGFQWSGTHKISRKNEWPDWRPPAEMIARERAKGRILPAHMEGGTANPLGARALYIGSTLYRIHGTNQPWSIGQAVSSGCIRMRNEDVMDLYERTPVGTKVVVG